jgi:glyoxylase-like metal-dependent hydrolase (beta-lactamase superfamily II)
MAEVQVGEFRIARILDHIHWWDGGTFFGVVPKTLWSRKVTPDDLNRIPVAFNCYLIQGRGHTVLVETGCGDKPDERMRERINLPADAAPLAEVISGHGFDPRSIDTVINSHLHWDHCGGNTILDGGGARPAFPGARYFASRGEWEHAHERLSRDAVSYNDLNYDPLVASGQMTLVDDDCEVAPGIRMRRAPGHNRDMCVITVASGGETFCFFSDLVPTAAHTQPTWMLSFDLYPLQTIENKHLWMGAAADRNWICGFSHEVEMNFARIRRHPKTHFAAEAVA